MNHRRIIVDIVVCVGFMLIFGYCTVFADTIGKVNDTSVNIRQGASTGSEVLAQADTGFDVRVLGREGDFYRISANGFDLAYIHSDYVDLLSAKGVVSDDRVNVRKQPTTSSEIIDVLDSGKELTIVGVTGLWYTIAYNSGYAYIHKDFVSGDMLSGLKIISTEDLSVPASAPSIDVAVAAPSISANEQAQQAPPQQEISTANSGIYALVNSNTGLKFRSGPSLNADVLSVLPYGEVLDVIFFDDAWTHVEFEGRIGYVSSEFVDISRGQRPQRIVRTLGSQVVDYAKQFLGTPYVYGGNSLTKGVDCSGFTYQVMLNFGKKLNRHSASQLSNGTKINKSDLLPGDLVFFNAGGNSRISHVGIYIGNGQFIHASSGSKYCVTINSLSEAYYLRTYVSACRVLN